VSDPAGHSLDSLLCRGVELVRAGMPRVGWAPPYRDRTTLLRTTALTQAEVAAFPAKPDHIFDRDVGWADLVGFAADERPGATLGIVTGRRRQGKTLLRYEFARQTGGFYFGVTEATEAESLRRPGESLGQHIGAPAAVQLDSWATEVDALLGLGADRPRVVVLDEFPYLVGASRELPSVI